MNHAYVCDYVRTPIGRFGGVLSSIRADDLAAIPLNALSERNPNMDLSCIDEICLGCANQSGEDNRNVARMALLLAGFPTSVPASTINRLCGSGMDAIAYVTRQIWCGEADLTIAGGVENMSRAPFVMPKAETAFARQNVVYDTTIGWRFINPKMKLLYGVDSMPETAENVATEFKVSRIDQDTFALSSQTKTAKARKSGVFDQEIVSVSIKVKKGEIKIVSQDEHPRITTMDKLASLSAPFSANGTVTAGNASGINDGSAALIVASEKAVKKHGLTPIAKIRHFVTSGCEPRIMGIGPVAAVKRLCSKFNISLADFDIIELNEAFASQSLAVLRKLKVEDDDERVNPNGGAIALGHPLGMSGARITGTACLELQRRGKQLALATMCVGTGQGIATVIESV